MKCDNLEKIVLITASLNCHEMKMLGLNSRKLKLLNIRKEANL